MSRIGVPSIKSAPETVITGPSGVWSSTSSSFTADRPMALGRKGERVANTPIRVLPPSLGGRTVGDQCSRTAWENCQISQRWENPSIPRRASGFRYSGSNTILARRASTTPLCRGIPNLVGKSVRIRAMIFISSVCSIVLSLRFLRVSSVLLYRQNPKTQAMPKEAPPQGLPFFGRIWNKNLLPSLL